MFDPARGYPQVVPYVRYADPTAAVRWLSEVLGASEAVRLTLPDGRVGHAELRVGDGAVIAVGLATSPDTTSPDPSTPSAMTLVFVADVDHAARRAVELGGTLVDAPTDRPWGLRQAVVADPDGHVWEPSSLVADVAAHEWGAEMVGPWFDRTTPGAPARTDAAR